MQYIENKTCRELKVGDSAELTRTLKFEDIDIFAVVTGDVNPAHVDEDYAKSDMFHKIIAHGMWGGALISAVLGAELPGRGTIYLNQNLSCRQAVRLGDTVTVRVTVAELKPEHHQVTLDCLCINESGETVIQCQALVLAPTEKVRRPRTALPDVHLHVRGAPFDKSIKETESLDPVTPAVVHPGDALSLEGGLEAKAKGMIIPARTGPKGKIDAAVAKLERDLSGIEIVDVPHSHTAAETTVALTRSGKVQILKKGKLHTDEVLGPVVKKATGLRNERRMSHIFALAAGIDLGARLPIILTSRADGVTSPLASAAITQLYVHHQPVSANL